MARQNKHVFWQALIVALVIFWAGIIIGVMFEDSRFDKLQNFYFRSETDIFDISLQSSILEGGEFDCKFEMRKNIDFADRIYNEARELEKYDSSSVITDDIVEIHRRYDLLRTMLWMSVIEMQEKCGADEFNTVVYLYDYVEPEVDVRARQSAMGGVLGDLKNKHGDGVILIPIAYDTDITSLDLMRVRYDLGKIPVVLINQKDKVTELFTLEEIENFIV